MVSKFSKVKSRRKTTFFFAHSVQRFTNVKIHKRYRPLKTLYIKVTETVA